jgi:predicted Zn-dependent peptidase
MTFLNNALTTSALQPGYTVERYLNGLRAIFSPLATARVEIELIIPGGSSFEHSDEGVGCAHLAEHCAYGATPGTEKYRKSQQVHEMGLPRNGVTSRNSTIYSVGTYTGAEEVALEYLADQVFLPDYDPRRVEDERMTIQQELRESLSDPRRIVRELLLDLAFRDSSYGHTGGGTFESINQISLESARSYRERVYQPQSMTLLVVGGYRDEVPEIARRLFGSAFSDLTSTELELAVMKPSPIQHVPANLPSSFLALGFPGSVTDSIEAACRPLIHSILTGDAETPFCQALRSEGLAYTPSFEFVAFSPSAALHQIVIGCPPGRETQAIERVYMLIGDSLLQGIDPRHFDIARARLQTAYMRARDQISSIGPLLREGAKLSQTDEFLLTFEEQHERVMRITAEELAETAEKIFRRDDSATVVLGP